MAGPRLTRPELQIMEVLWSKGPCSVREILDALPKKGRPAFTTVQTMVYRLEVKKAVKRVKKISNANIFDAVVSRADAHARLIDDFLSIFGGQMQPLMAGLIEGGRLKLSDVREAERALRNLDRDGD